LKQPFFVFYWEATSIFNIKGQVVKNLVKSQQEAGDYTVIWNGCNNSGVNVASGVYIYQLQAGNRFVTKKMVVAK